jgi:hypothetical protein
MPVRDLSYSSPIAWVVSSSNKRWPQHTTHPLGNMPQSTFSPLHCFSSASLTEDRTFPNRHWHPLLDESSSSTNTSFLNSLTEGSNYAEKLQDNFKPLLDFYNVFTVCETKEVIGFGIVGSPKPLKSEVATNSSRLSRRSRLHWAHFQRTCITQIAITEPSANSETQTIRCGSTCPKCFRERLRGPSNLHITVQSATQERLCFIDCLHILEV